MEKHIKEFPSWKNWKDWPPAKMERWKRRALDILLGEDDQE